MTASCYKESDDLDDGAGAVVDIVTAAAAAVVLGLTG